MRWWMLWASLAVSACGQEVVDEDGDGFGSDVDCDDGDAAVNPDATEVCDGIDNDCDGGADDDDDDPPADAVEYFSDADSDGFGGASLGLRCDPPAGAVTNGDDCDDAIVGTNPVTSEVCDGIDNDCDGLIDDEDPNWASGVQWMWYRDADNDGYGSSASLIEQCEQPDGYVNDDGDCDDTDPERNPGAPEICDGKDNNCDVSAGLLVDDDDPTLDTSSLIDGYVDADGDGFGSDTPAQFCNPLTTPNVSVNSDDCDDTSSARFPGAPEQCDGTDYDCDGLADGDDWADEGQAYRALITTTAPSTDTQGPLVAVSLDMADLLDQLGDVGDFDAASVRVFRQDCDAGVPEVAAEFVDGVEGLLDEDVPDTLTDDLGTLVFRDDADGDFSTVDARDADSVVVYGVYFSSSTQGAPTAPPAQATAMTFGGSPPGIRTVDNGISQLTLDAAFGGTATFLGPSGGIDSVAAQADSEPGNGVYFGPTGGGPTGSWASTVLDTMSTLTPVHEGTMLAVYEATGGGSNAHGAYAYATTYAMVNGRPEIYVRTTYTTTAASHVGPQGTFWSQAVRPWQIDNEGLLGLGAATTERDGAFAWVRATYADDTLGVLLGWRQLPVHLANPVITGTSRFIALAGQDVEATPAGDETDVLAGVNLLDDALLVVYPYAGAWAATSSDAFGALDGVSTVVGAPTLNPAF